jgi:hypothetical protein
MLTIGTKHEQVGRDISKEFGLYFGLLVRNRTKDADEPSEFREWRDRWLSHRATSPQSIPRKDCLQKSLINVQAAHLRIFRNR